MKRRAVLKIIEKAARERGLLFSIQERTNHTAIQVGGVLTFIGRHREIPDLARLKLFKQLEPALGKDWWRN